MFKFFDKERNRSPYLLLIAGGVFIVVYLGTAFMAPEAAMFTLVCFSMLFLLELNSNMWDFEFENRKKKRRK